MRRPRPTLFTRAVLTVAAIWLALEWVLPYVAMWIVGAARPLPVPAAARLIYVALAVVGALVQVTSSDEAFAEFVRPVRALLRGPDPVDPAARRLRLVRAVVLTVIPLAIGALAWSWATPRAETPTVLRLQHPTMPGAYERLRNPFRGAGEAQAIADGRDLFQLNCRPCHGAAADGAGPLAWALRLKPANFTDPGTIATVVEPYAFWRVTEGAPGLPGESTPWDSAMPAWREDLTEAERWKAVMAAYDLGGVEPRRPEKLGSASIDPSVLDRSPTPDVAPASRLPVREPAGQPSGLLLRGAAAHGSRFLVPDAVAQSKPLDTADDLERGRQIYVKRCAACHGERGDGQGPVAAYLDPRPRDFTAGVFKLRSTPSGEPPTDDDLLAVVTNGVSGTAMPAWTTLSPDDRRRVVAYVKRFSDAFETRGTRAASDAEPRSSAALLARGRDVYRSAKCWECHGAHGRGDGPSAATLKDDAGDAIRPTDLTKGWRLKGGREAANIYTRFVTGLDGTPMPSYADALPTDDRWALAHYVRSLQTREEPSAAVVLRARRITGAVPRDAADPRWADAPSLTLPLAGQAIVKPRWQAASVDAVTVRALWSDRDLAFLLEWNDPVKDVEHRPAPMPELRESTYPKLTLERGASGPLRDAVRLQFPITLRPIERPRFLLGSAGRPVTLWHWRADANERGERAVVKERADGPRQVAESAPGAQDVDGRGAWADGRWRVVMTRALAAGDSASDVTFEPGRLVPFAVQAWDGANGERDLMMSISSWHFVLLEVGASANAWLLGLGAAGAVALAEWGLVRAVSREGVG